MAPWPTACAPASAPSRPAPTLSYTDNRPTRASGLQLAGFTTPAQMVFNPPREPSLYLLDASDSAFYQLSLKLALVRQFRPYFPLPAPISALAFDAAKPGTA